MYTLWQSKQIRVCQLHIGRSVTVRFVRVSFCFLWVPDCFLGQNGHNGQSGQNGHKSGINTLHELKFYRFQVHYIFVWRLKSIHSVIWSPEPFPMKYITTVPIAPPNSKPRKQSNALKEEPITSFLHEYSEI